MHGHGVPGWPTIGFQGVNDEHNAAIERATFGEEDSKKICISLENLKEFIAGLGD